RGLPLLRSALDEIDQTRSALPYMIFQGELALVVGGAGQVEEGVMLIEKAIERCEGREGSAPRWSLKPSSHPPLILTSRSESMERGSDAGRQRIAVVVDRLRSSRIRTEVCRPIGPPPTWPGFAAAAWQQETALPSFGLAPHPLLRTPNNIGADLREIVFDSLLPALGDRRCIFLSPAGDLTRLPFEVL